jgi:cell division protein FtsQ
MKSTGSNLNRRSSSRGNSLQSVYRQRRARRKKIDFSVYLLMGFKVLSGFLLTVCLSVAGVFAYSFVIQCDYLRAEKIEVKGITKLSRTEVLNQAGIADGVNILSVNLDAVRKKLSVHSGIYAAEVQRSFPKGLAIVIEEQSPLAVVDFGDKYLMNVHGKIYKKWIGDIPQEIPVVTGLDYSDFENQQDPENPSMVVLNLLKSRRGFLEKNGMALLKTVHVDRQMGITLNFDPTCVLKLGYGNYEEKWARLGKVLNFMKSEYEFKGFDSIDLSNTSRVVLKPVKPAENNKKNEEV